MDMSVFLAQAFAIYFLVFGIAMLFFRSRFQSTVNEILSSSGQILILSIISLILGILLVLVHNIWSADWRVLITLLAWLTLIQGVVRLYCPDFVRKAAHHFNNDKFYYAVTLINIAIGAYLGYYGFWVS